MALAARELHPAFADHGGQSFRQHVDKVAASRYGRPQYLIIGRVRPAITDIFENRPLEQRNVLRHHRDRLAQALLRDFCDVLAIDHDAALLDVIKPLQQHKNGGLAAAGLSDQTDPLTRLETEAEFVEHLNSTGITERNIVEGNGRAALDQRLGFRMVAQLVWQQQGGNRFGQTRDMLGDVDQRHRKIARRTQDRKPQGTNQYHVTGGGVAALPKRDRPAQQADCGDDPADFEDLGQGRGAAQELGQGLTQHEAVEREIGDVERPPGPRDKQHEPLIIGDVAQREACRARADVCHYRFPPKRELASPLPF